MSRNLYDLIGLAAGICFILALKGLSSPKSARRGNLIGAVGASVATLIVFFYTNDGKALNNQTLILAAIAFGTLVGVPAAQKVQMTQMPQLVALFNGVGGGAAALVAIVAPTAPIRFPRRADFGEDKPLSAKIKQIPAAKPIRS